MIILLFLICLTLYAGDSTTDSLLLSLQETTNDSGKVNTLNLLTQRFILMGEYDQALEYGEQALKLSSEMDNKVGMGDALNHIGNIHNSRSEYSLALNSYFKSLYIRKLAKDQKGVAGTLNNIGNVYLLQSNYPNALEYHLKSLKIKVQLGDSGAVARSYNNIGSIYNDQGDYSRALEYHLKSLHLKEMEGKGRPLASSYLNVGNVYYYLEDYQRAQEYFEKCLILSDSLDITKGVAQSCNNLGVIHHKVGEISQALEYCFRSQIINSTIGDRRREADTYNNLGSIYNTVSELPADSLQKILPQGWVKNRRALMDSAVYYYRLGFELHREVGNERGMTSSLLGLGEHYSILNNSYKAIEVLEEALVYAEKIKARKETYEIYEKLASIWWRIGNYEKAYSYHDKYSSLKDSVFNEEKDMRLGMLQVTYDIEKKDKEIALLNKEKELDRIKLNNQTKILWFLGLSACMILGILILLIRQSRIRSRLLQEETLRLRQDLEHNQWKLSSTALHLVEKNKLLHDLNLQLTDLKTGDPEQITKIKREIGQTINLDDDWQQFLLHFDKVHPSFFKELKNKSPQLTPNDEKLCAYIRMNLSTKEIAQLLHITPASVKKAKNRLRKKLNLSEGVFLPDYLHSF